MSVLRRLEDHGPDLILEYLSRYREDGSTLVARDAAKWILPEYRQDQTRHNRLVDGAASALADAVRRTLLAEPPILPRNGLLIVTGAPASGKTAAASTMQTPTLEIKHETILTSQEKATRHIDEAFRAGRTVKINLIYTDNPRLNVRRMILRARRIGRTVPLAYLAKTYSGVPLLVRDIKREFKSRIELLIANNSGAEDDVVFHQRIDDAVSSTGRYTYSKCLEIMDNELEQIHQAEAVPEEVLQEARLR